MYRIYLISCGEENLQYKIGYTKRDVSDRLREFKTGNSGNLNIVATFETKWGSKLENMLHRKYRSKKIEGEWFGLDNTEVENFLIECKKQDEILNMLATENTYIIERGGF